MTRTDPPRRRRSRARRLAGAIVVDVTPLRDSSPFRWLYIGQVGGQLARQLLVVAVPFEVFVRTDSSLLVGLVGLAQLVPLLVFSVVGGTVADAFDRRRVLVITQLLLVATALALAANVVLDGPTWLIFAVVAVNAAVFAVENPSRTAIIPALVPRTQLASAFALNQTLAETAQVVGPAVAGLVMARFGIDWAYWLAAIAGVVSALALLPLGGQRPEGATGRVTVAATVEGWRYVRERPLVQQALLIDLNAMVLAMPRALFPVIGTVVLGGDASTVGLLHAAPGAGAFVGAVTTGWVSTVKRQGRVVLIAVGVWSVAIAAFGLTRNLALALLLLGIAGAADVVSNVFRNAIVQAAVPDALRGRITALKTAYSAGGPQLGDAKSGAVAAATTPTFAVVSGGLASLVGAGLIAWRGRTLWDQTTDDDVDRDAAGGV